MLAMSATFSTGRPDARLISRRKGIGRASALLAVSERRVYGQPPVVRAVYSVVHRCGASRGRPSPMMRPGSRSPAPPPKRLESLRRWLVHNNATVMAVLLLVIGVTVIGKGIGSF
jgi:hypothetical protein